mgnify:CR=1 FL=1
MGLEQSVLNCEEDYNASIRRKFALNFFSGLSKNIEISPEIWRGLLKIGEEAYFTTFTDDSDYLHGAMKFSILDNLAPEFRDKILNHIYYAGNYIVKHHVEDYYRENGLNFPSDKDMIGHAV